MTKPTRLNPKNRSKISILDNIIPVLHKFYQDPKCLAPIDAGKNSGKHSHHLSRVWEPVNVINNKPFRKTKQISVWPITESGLKLFGLWLENKDWSEIEETHDSNTKVNSFTSDILLHVKRYLPIKSIKIASDGLHWCNEKVKNLKRLKCSEYNNQRHSPKWVERNTIYQKGFKTIKPQPVVFKTSKTVQFARCHQRGYSIKRSPTRLKTTGRDNDDLRTRPLAPHPSRS